MRLCPAKMNDADAIHAITQQTIRTIYPHYYPEGAVDFFLQHHNPKAIARDIQNGCVHLLWTADNQPIGTVTIRENEILRLFVLPAFQGKGYGKLLLDFAEALVSKIHPEIVVDASFAAKALYLKRGYRETEYHQIKTQNGDYLCYDVMQKPSVCNKENAHDSKP